MDNLCKDIFDAEKGVSTYIINMEEYTDGNVLVPYWYKDLKRLKRYWHIRNLIAHETNVYEEDYCTLEDGNWILDFYQKILTGQDPLSIYQNALKQQESNQKNKYILQIHMIKIMIIMIVTMTMVMIMIVKIIQKKSVI